MAAGPIIVGVDPERAEHRDAVACGALLAQALSAPLLLINVYGPRRSVEEQAARHERALGAIIRTAQDQVHGLDVEPLAAPGGSAAGVLHRLADERHAQALVVGSSPHAMWGHVETGEMSERLLNGGRAPVVVVPRGYSNRPQELGPVGIGYAVTPESEDAVRAGIAIAAGARSPIKLITVFPGEDRPHTPFPEAGGEVRHEVSHELYGRVAAIAEARATAHLFDGDPVETLARQSGHLGLLVLGSRSYGALHAVLLGGVSSLLLHRAACPVMVVPHTRDEVREVAPYGQVATRVGLR